MTAAEYINGNMLRHGWGEAWVPDDVPLEKLLALRGVIDLEVADRAVRGAQREDWE